jgi:hypothetical protein
MIHIVSSHSHPGTSGRSGKGRTSGEGNGAGKIGSGRRRIGSVGKGSASLDVEEVSIDAGVVASCCGRVHFYIRISGRLR